MQIRCLYDSAPPARYSSSPHPLDVYKRQPQHYEVYRPTEEDSLSFEELQAKNSDVCGWITIYGTHVDYPVVRGADNGVYLMRDPEGNYRMSGSIFIDVYKRQEYRYI